MDASQERFAVALSIIAEGVVVQEADGRIEACNQSAERILGLTADQMVGRTSVDPRWRAIHEDGSPFPGETHPAMVTLRTGQPVSNAIMGVHKPDGTLTWISMNSRAILREGKPEAVVTTFEDVTAQRTAEDALRTREERWRLAVEGARDGIWDWNAETDEVFFSRRWKEILGFEDSEIANASSEWEERIHPEDKALTMAARNAHLEGKSPFYEAEYRLKCKDGTWKWVRGRGTVVSRDAAGKPRRFVGVQSDITERKRAEEALRESEETHRALVDGLPDIVMRFDREGRHLFVSGNVRDTVDMEAAQFIGKTHAELGFPEEQCRFWEDAIRRVFDSGAPFETEFIFEGKAGPVIFNWRLVPERDAQGAVSSLLSISRDITAHRKAEREYQTLFREMLDGFALHEIILDADRTPVDYRFLAVNPAFERMTGLKAASAVGRTVLEVLPGIERRWIETYGKVALTGEAVHFENHSAELGKHFEVSAFRPAPGQFVCIFRDITDSKRAEEEREKLQLQLAQVQKMESIGRLAGGVAHDFNNLLTVINGYSQLALGKLSEGDPLRPGLEEIHKAGERAAGLTRQLLAFSRKQVLQPRVLDLNRIVEDMQSMLERLVGEDVEVRLALCTEIPRVDADPHQLEQVIMNLAVNARDAMPHGGRLLIETGLVERDESYARSHPEVRPGRYALLAMSDTGVGMDEATRQRIFEPFFTTKVVGQGTGLGLSMVQGIVAQSGGYIDVYSAPGQGTTFKVYLPVLTEAAADAGKPACVPPLRGQEIILVVEDQAEVRDYAVAVLSEYGYHPILAANADEALAICEQHGARIHLILTDVVMPHTSGRELAARLTVMLPGVKVLFMSGYTDNVIVHHGVLEEGAHFIQKPFSPEELAVKVREVLGPPVRAARILVADDEAGVRFVVREVLEAGGYEVIEAAEGKQALRLALAEQVDVVITDLVMPEQEGIETIQALRREAPGVGIIAISGAFGGQFLKVAEKLGADAVVEKPVSAEVLLAKVAEVLASRR